jgi:hypothetical protein
MAQEIQGVSVRLRRLVVLAQLAAMLTAWLLFRALESRATAGLVAGSTFAVVQLATATFAARTRLIEPRGRRVFVLAWVCLCLFTIPMLLNQLLRAMGIGERGMLFGWIPMGPFHGLASLVSLLLLGLTLYWARGPRALRTDESK